MPDRLQYENRDNSARPPCQELLASTVVELRRIIDEYHKLICHAAQGLRSAAAHGCADAESALIALQAEDRLSQHQEQVIAALQALSAALAGAPLPEPERLRAVLAAALERDLTVEAVRAPLLAAVTGTLPVAAADAAAAETDSAAGEADLF